MKVPFNDLKRAVLSEGNALTERLLRVAESGWFVLGEEVQSFEREFSAYQDTAHAISVANGTDAIELALRAVLVNPGDRVVTVANAGMYSSTAIHRIGAEPIYVEVDDATMNVSVDALASIASNGIAAVIVTHLYGRMADIEGISRWCARHEIPLIEDCAQAHGARRGTRRAGTFGTIGCFSFYPTKNLGGLGDGGAVVTADEKLAARVRALRQYGWEGKYEVRVAGGMNSRLDELQAAVLRLRLASLDDRNRRRVEIARAYSAGICHPRIVVPDVSAEGYVAHLYVIRSEARDALRKHLAVTGVSTDVHYPIPDHLQRAYASRHTPALPITEALARQVLTLPCFPELTDAEVQHVVNACNEWNNGA